MKLRVLLGAVVMAALAGCGTQPQIVYHDSMYLPQFPSLLTSPTNVEPPPDKATYMAASSDQQKQMLTKAYINQTGNVLTCNIDKAQINTWYAQQQAVVAQANAASGTVASSAPVAASGVKATQ
jgi:hypothetical protein